MTNLEMIEFIDEFLSEQEDFLHGNEGENCTKSRNYLEMIKKQLALCNVSYQRGLLFAFEKWQQTQFVLPDEPLKVVDKYLNSK